MKNHGMIIALVLFVLIIAGMFMFAFLKKSEINGDRTQVEDTPVVVTSPYDSITRIDAKHFYIDGVHTLAGEILMPTPCDLLEWNEIVAESFPEQVTVAFTVINTTDTCAQVVTPQRFKSSFSGVPGATIRATMMGREVDLNLIPAGDGETPDDFELFIKG